MASFGLAVNRRWQNRQTNEWEEQVSFFDVKCWAQMAENVGESLNKGSRVSWSPAASSSARGRPSNGDKRSKVEVVADEIGPEPALGHRQRHARTSAAKDAGAGSGGGGGNASGRQRAQRQRSGGGYNDDEEPF